MTGYGKASEIIDGLDITAEIKSVNHRYFEFSVKVPRGCAFLEEKIKRYVSSRVTRGKIDCSVIIDFTGEGDITVTPNKPVISGYLSALSEIGENYGIEGGIRLIDILHIPDALTVKTKALDEEKTAAAVLRVLEKAVDSFIEMRKTEGEKLKADVSTRLDTILSLVEKVEEQGPETLREYRERLYKKLKDVLEDRTVDESRVLTECAIFADKIAVDEETVRLRSHISQMKSLLESEEPAGKKMDFVVQEMNRETNTIGSKAQNVKIANTVVNIKAEIEKIREQIQNIE